MLPRRPNAPPTGVERGAYVLADPEDGPTESSWSAPAARSALPAAAVALAGEASGPGGLDPRAGSRSSRRTPTTRTDVLPAGSRPQRRGAATFGWDRYADDCIGIDHFGASAPGEVPMEKFGFTAEHVVERARALLAAG